LKSSSRQYFRKNPANHGGSTVKALGFALLGIPDGASPASPTALAGFLSDVKLFKQAHSEYGLVEVGG